jgi:hypothetical protein
VVPAGDLRKQAGKMSWNQTLEILEGLALSSGNEQSRANPDLLPWISGALPLSHSQ